jgi:CspA family cold shock protein
MKRIRSKAMQMVIDEVESQRVDVKRILAQDKQRIAPGSGIKTGVVKWFNADKGFGFISQDDGSPDIHVYFKNIISPVNQTLAQGDTVSFRVNRGPKGLTALNVERINRTAYITEP